MASDIQVVDGPDGLYVLKRALPRLRVAAEWFSDPARSLVEASALKVMAGIIGQDTVPRVLWIDPGRHEFAMELVPPRLRNWKQDLMSGRIDPATASRAGHLLGQLHAGSARRPDLREQFGDTRFFEELRIRPYFTRVAERNPDLAADIEAVVAGMADRRSALVHGDFSPKNILADGADVVLLDCEVAHWGDPRFDLAFCLTHLALKSLRRAAPVAALAMAGTALLSRLPGGRPGDHRRGPDANPCLPPAGSARGRLASRLPVGPRYRGDQAPGSPPFAGPDGPRFCRHPRSGDTCMTTPISHHRVFRPTNPRLSWPADRGGGRRTGGGRHWARMRAIGCLHRPP